MSGGQSELAEQIDANPDLGSASRVRLRCDLLAKMIEEHTPATIVLTQFRLLTNSVMRAVQLEIMAREVKHRSEGAQSNVVAEETRSEFNEEDFFWCPHCLTDLNDCDCPPRPSKEDVKTVLDYVRIQANFGFSWLDSLVADKLRLPLSTIHDVVRVSSELGLVKSHVVWLPEKRVQ